VSGRTAVLSAPCVLRALAGHATAAVAAPGTSVVVSQIDGRATHRHDFIALFDRGAQPGKAIAAARAGFPIQQTSEP
jgi:hypothetical protein